ncbi:MAG: hypothetical protein HDR43_02240, partial [Mycoplasma sp.]|nr:hypothetical protein [Mycoplasma sp.]
MPNPLKMKDTGKNNLVSIKTYSNDVVFSPNNSLAKVFLIKNSDIENARNNNNSIDTIYDVTNSIAAEYQYTNSATNIMLIAPLIPMSRHQEHSYGSAGRRDFKLMTFTYNSTNSNALVYQGPFQYDESNNTIQKTINGNNNTAGSSNLSADTSSSDIFKFDSSGFNGGWKTWTKEFNNAMLIPTRNMFNENVVTFAYPYASPESSFSNSVVLPIFNVWQLSITDRNAGNSGSIGSGSFTKAFNFGEKIYDAYSNNGWSSQQPNSNTIMWYPWPGAVRTSNTTTNNYYSQYTNQLYNRLINVSPYDNAVVYAARPNFTIDYTFTPSIGDMLNGNNSFNDQYASFWIGRSFNNSSSSTGTYVSNFTISNSNSISTNGQISSELIGGSDKEKINTIYQNGFWFDIKSIYADGAYGDYANLYFNTNGTLKDKAINNQNSEVKSSPIGIIRPNIGSIYSKEISQMLNIVTQNNQMNKITIKESANYSSYITSRANLTKWYPNMYQSLTKGVNTITNGQLFLSSTISNKQVVTNFESKVTNDSNSPYELFSIWKQSSNYYYIPTATYTINTNNNGLANTNLNLSTKFQLGSWTNSFISNASDIDKAKTIEIPMTVPNVSWQFLNSWSTNAKLNNYNSPTSDDILGNMSLNWISNSNDQGIYGDGFGSQNNMGYWNSNDSNLTFESITSTGNSVELSNTTEINKYPLRVVFAINPDPDNLLSDDSSANSWLTKFKSEGSGKFTKKYPLVATNNDETSFNQILREYIDWKAKNLTYSNNVSNPSLGSLGLGQITIDAYLELNPYWEKLNNGESTTIYTLPANTKILIDNTTNIKYIYKDDYQGSRSIYKQNSTNFGDNSKYGFGTNVVSDLNKSWSDIPNPSLNLKMPVDPTKVANVLVRDVSTTTNNIFTARYIEDSANIILEPKANKLDWAKTHLPTYSLMTGTGIIFEYKTKDSSKWQSFNTTNRNLKYDENTGSYTITNSEKNIESIRFRLSPLSSDGNGNIVTKYDNWNNGSILETFISDEVKLEIIQINVDYNWFNDVTLAFQGQDTWNKFLNDENGEGQFVQAINTYETSIKNNLSNNTIKNIIQIKYSLNESDQTYVDANNLYNQLKRKWQNYNSDNGGIIALYNEDKTNTNSTKIYTKFELNNENAIGNYELNEISKNGNNYIKKTNINFKINLKEYVDVLQSTKTSVVLGSGGNGSIANFTPPSMTGDSGTTFLAGKTFDQIVELLKKFGVGIEYQKSDSSWTENKLEITSYNPTDPKINIRFKESVTYNVKTTITGTGTITNSSQVSLQLNVPLLIQWNDNILDDFRTDFIIGNTKNIVIDQSKEQELISKIAEFNNKNNNNDSNNELWNNLSTYLEIQYAIGDINNVNSNYYNRENFITHLSNLTETQYNNQINIKLVLKDSNIVDDEAKFILDSNADQNQILYQNNNTNIKIFIINNYTDLLSQIRIAPNSTSSNISFIYPEELDKIKNGEIEGLQLAYSLKQNINYNDPTGSDINNSWVDIEPTSVPTNATILKIKVYTSDTNKYIFEGTTIIDIDLTKIPKPIDVDNNWFSNNPLTINSNGYLKDIQLNDITDWEEKIWNKSNAIQTDNLLKQYVSIKYNIDGNGSYNAQELLNELKRMQQDYSSSNLGIVYLWDGVRGTKINATFTKKDDLIVFTDESGNYNENLTNYVQTNQIKTYIDLSNYAKVLSTNKTSVQLKNGQIGTIETFTPPIIINEDGFLSGKTFDQISEVLTRFDVTIKFNNGINNNWEVKNSINSYNPNNAILYLGVEYNDQAKPNIVFNFGNNNTSVEDTTLMANENALTILKLQAPVAITVDLGELKKLAFQGNTKNITNVDNIKEQIIDIVNKIKQENLSAITDNDLNLEIRFSLNEIKLEENINDPNSTDDGIWYTFDRLNEILSSSTTNYNSNKVLAKFHIKNNPVLEGGINKYQLSSDISQIINTENLDSKSDFNIYINDTEQTKAQWIKENIKLSGSQDNFNINGYDDWQSSLPQGLTVQFNISPDSTLGTNDENQPDNTKWLDDLNNARPISATRDFWIRFKVGEAYVFESASQSDTSYSNPIKLDASAILVSLKIKSEWLKQIILTGNLKDLTINEEQAIEAIKSAGQMPQNDIIKIEYTYDEIHWLNKKQFEAKLQELKGAKDDINWIILREDIKVRFVLNKEINDDLPNKYVLEIDGDNIYEDNSNNINVLLITNSLNSDVKGYINLDKFNEFNADNFKVTGTNSSANLITSNVNAINDKLNPYSSNGLFSILYKWNSNSDYLDTNKIWIPGQDIKEITQLSGTYENRFFGIQFKMDDTNYELYKNDINQANNYEISTITTPAIQMQISIEIINPFTSTNSQINVKFLNVSSKPQWYNNEGAFTFTIEEPQTSGGTKIYNSFDGFISNLGSSYTNEMKNALELVYYVSATELNEEEYKEATSVNEINKYDKSSEKYNIWKTLNDSNDISQLNYHLKVGDYVIIALRIKEKSLTTDTNPNGYVLKDNQHSPTKAIRVSGYKVHTDYIDVDWSSMKLRNIGLAESASYGLDGYAMLDQISLKQSNNNVDNSNDYLNVSLRLNYFTEFYEKNGEVLVSGSGSRLVKRDPNEATKDGYYKDSEG